MQIPEEGVWPMIAGAAGAALSLQFVEGMTWKQKFVMTSTGFFSAVFLTTPIMEFVGMPYGWTKGMAFLVGLFSWAAIGGIMHTLQKADWWGLIQDVVRRIFNRGA